MGSLYGATVIYSFPYRDKPTEEWSSVFHFKDAPPSDSTAWDTAFSGLSDICRLIIPSSASIVRIYGYDSDDAHAHAVASVDYEALGSPLAGSFLPGTGDREMSGDQAAMVEWRTDRKNSRGKWVYLRKYLHAGYLDASDVDLLATDYKAALQTYANHFWTGSGVFGGGIRSRAHSDAVTSGAPGRYVTTRTLRRRGKRPLG